MSDAPVTVRLTLPLPPGVNNQYVTAGNRRVLSKSAKEFKKEVERLLLDHREKNRITTAQERTVKESFIGVYMTFFFETPLKRDLDGGLKIALDAIASGLGFDDRKVVDIHLTKRIDPLRPRLEIEMETITDWQFDESYVYLGDTEDDASAQ
ncbi:MAG TPA: RusA family crossover junction endodeoxyribonuclease [Thermomicrobiales bacterium]|nr:RusA family crossover junction endodeoxyribonuclease [Thermomicrobiales bacterium]